MKPAFTIVDVNISFYKVIILYQVKYYKNKNFAKKYQQHKIPRFHRIRFFTRCFQVIAALNKLKISLSLSFHLAIKPSNLIDKLYQNFRKETTWYNYRYIPCNHTSRRFTSFQRNVKNFSSLLFTHSYSRVPLSQQIKII